MIDIKEKYFVKTVLIPTGKGYLQHLKVMIFERTEDGQEKQIGEYVRCYPALFNTFVPFKQGDKEYALYSQDYTATRIMEMPSCKDICGEEPRMESGFCPTGYLVDPNGQFAFVSGCVWGDDTSWKLEYFDLSRLSEGVITREAKFGYLELPDLPLSQCVTLDTFDFGDNECPVAWIATKKLFYMDKSYSKSDFSNPPIPDDELKPKE